MVRTEGGADSGDTAVDEAFTGFGSTYDFFWDVFQRSSVDDTGTTLIGTVHYGTQYANAFWDGTQMVFGDGDGEIFNRLTIAVDVIGHELTHGVTSYTANLMYMGQSGALNESVSDVFGSLVKQYSASPQQTAEQADWLIGAGLFTSQVHGQALRSLKAPGTAYDDPVLGKDPQPDHMDRYVDTFEDNGGVHINSGIPNRAFYLAATAFGGYAWEKAGSIWYATLTDARLQPTAQFQDFASLTAENAATLFGSAERQVIVDAWQQVGISLGGGPLPVSDDWVLHFGWEPETAFGQAQIAFNTDGTFAVGGTRTGKWHQTDGTLLLIFDNGPAVYGGTIVGSVGSGAMSTFTGPKGSWYLTKQGITGVRSARVAGESTQRYDAAGNRVPVGTGAGPGARRGTERLGWLPDVQ